MRRKQKHFLGESILPFRRYRFLLEPGVTGASGGGGGAPTLAETPDVEPVNGGPPREFSDLANATVDLPTDQGGGNGGGNNGGSALTPADPNQRAGHVQGQHQAQQQSASEWQSIRDAAAAYGYQFGPQVQDDRTALAHLIQQASVNRQADYYAQLGRQLAPQAPAIQQFLGQQRQQQQAPPQRQPWEAPEFDERWAALVDRDPATGLFIGKPGVPAEIVGKVNAYVEWKSNFDRNPAAVINGMVEARAKEIASTTFREQFEQQQREQTINQIVHENSSWLYQVDQSGQRMLNPMTGQFMPTPVGARYLHHLQQVQQMGVRDPRQQDALAKNLVRGELAMQQYQGQQQQGQQQNPMTQQAMNRPNVNPLQAQPPQQRRNNPHATEPPATGKSLMEMLREDLAAEGVTDSDFANLGG